MRRYCRKTEKQAAVYAGKSGPSKQLVSGAELKWVCALSAMTSVKQLARLRQTFQHKNNETRAVCRRVKRKARAEGAAHESLQIDERRTGRVSSTIFIVVKKSRAYTDMEHGIELQELNCLDLGRVLHSRKSCADITHHIRNKMRSVAVRNVVLTHTIQSRSRNQRLSVAKPFKQTA